MTRPLPKFTISGLAALALGVPMAAQGSHFTVREAIQAEWARQPLALTEAQQAALPPADRARLERTLQRIGAPGAAALLPPELDKPTLPAWEALAQDARTPQARFTALFMLNRLKSPKALMALEGLSTADAATWPEHLHLEASIATARLNGAEVTPALQGFLDALQIAEKVDPVRAQAARLRLVLAGVEKDLLPPVPATPGSLLALMDAWNRAPWPARAADHRRMLANPIFHGSDVVIPGPMFMTLGIGLDQNHNGNAPPPPPLAPQFFPFGRLLEGLGKPAPEQAWPQVRWASEGNPHLSKEAGADRLLRLAAITAIQKFDTKESLRFAEAMVDDSDPIILASLLPTLRLRNSAKAEALRSQLLEYNSPIARAAAIEDLPAAPADLAALTARTWGDSQQEAQQVLIQSYTRWKLSPEDQQHQLRPWLNHPNWTCRWEAYQALLKLDPATPWPAAPHPTKTDAAIIREATRLAELARPVRLRISLSGKRSFTLRLDPTVAPMNVANLVLLARKGYFNGRLVPRVVPDFVVQMGSPHDTMDGGPGHTVRCENSLEWYGPGSVGMALSGKDTGGSQFFITTNATPHLTGRYTRLGAVEDPDRSLKLLDDLELGAKILTVTVLKP